MLSRCAGPLAAALLPCAAPLLSSAVGAEPPSARPGPAVEGFGPIFDAASPDFPTDTAASWRAVFDVAQGSAEPDQVNAWIESLARCLNMQARAGVPPAQLQLVLVLHGSAGRDALRAHGTRIELCGQTAASRGFSREQLAPGVELALSAMTALVALQSQGYALLGF